MHDQRDPSHPDITVSREVREMSWVGYSCVNHHLVNGGVIACTFDDPADAAALDVLREQYPGHEVVGVDARPLFARGGGIHCITQQQPAV